MKFPNKAERLLDKKQALRYWGLSKINCGVNIKSVCTIGYYAACKVKTGNLKIRKTRHNRVLRDCGLTCSVRKPAVDARRPLRKALVDGHAR